MTKVEELTRYLSERNDKIGDYDTHWFLYPEYDASDGYTLYLEDCNAKSIYNDDGVQMSVTAKTIEAAASALLERVRK